MPKYYKLIAENRAARHEFIIMDKIEAGLMLKGTEVKSIRQGKANLKDSFGRVEKNSLYIYGMHVSPYGQGNIHNADPMRPRKALLHAHELKKIIGKASEKGLTIVPLRLYFLGNWAKIEIGIAKGKKLHEKRETLKKRAIERDIGRELRERIKK